MQTFVEGHYNINRDAIRGISILIKNIMRTNYLYYTISILFFLLGTILSNTYRVYIYQNGIYDFHFADTIGNWVSVPAMSFLGLALNKFTNIYKSVGFSVLFFTFYEIIPFGTFDYYDLLATYICGFIICLSSFAYKRIKTLVK